MGSIILLVVLLALWPGDAWNAPLVRQSTLRSPRQPARYLEMKGKGGRVPIDQRGEFMKQQRMMEMREKMQASKSEGVPVFKVFVRPKVGGLWVPCGDLAGDQRATAVVNAWLSGFMTDMYKDQLDNGIAKSLFSQEDTFVKGLIENFKPFKKMKPEDLEFGYKVDFPGVVEKMGDKTMVLTREMAESKGVLDSVKGAVLGAFGGLFGGGNKDEKDDNDKK